MIRGVLFFLLTTITVKYEPSTWTARFRRGLRAKVSLSHAPPTPPPWPGNSTASSPPTTARRRGTCAATGTTSCDRRLRHGTHSRGVGGGGEEEELPDPMRAGRGSSSSGKKRFLTNFTQEEKDKMLAFAERVGWRIQKRDEAAVKQFCSETAIKRHVLKVWMHNNKHTLECRCSKRITRHAAKLIESSGAPSSSLLVSLPHKRQLKTLTNGTNTSTNTNTDTNFNLQKKIDTKMFECYVEDLWSSISVEKRISYAYLDSLWFSLYKGRSTKSKVLQWVKKKQIFLRKYIFVPIICWKHWSLLILCNFGEKRKSETNQPCMLLLDSLQTMDPKRLEPQIRRFVRDIYRSEGRKETDEYISKIPLLIPKVPQQRSGEECGVFVLYFLYLFIQTAPDSFSREGYASFLNEDWFKLEDLESFGKEIHRLCKSKDSSADPEDSSEDSMDIEQVGYWKA